MELQIKSEFKTVEVPMFGSVTVEENGFSFMDGGTHGCVGHTLTVGTNDRAEWSRRLDSMGNPDDCSGSGWRRMAAEDLEEVRKLASAVWELAGQPPVIPGGEFNHEVPRYCWAMVVCQGGVARILDGPPIGHPWSEPPKEVQAAINWMRKKVAEWCTEMKSQK